MDSPDKMISLEFQAISNRNNTEATPEKSTGFNESAWFAQELQAESMPYMKLKKWLLVKGLNKHQLDLCSGKPNLLHLWRSSSTYAKEAAAAAEAPAEEQEESPEESPGEESEEESSVMRLDVTTLDNSDVLFESEEEGEGMMARLELDLGRLKAQGLPAVLEEEEQVPVPDSPKGDPLRGSFKLAKSRAKQLSKTGMSPRARKGAGSMSCPAQVRGIDPRIQKIRQTSRAPSASLRRRHITSTSTGLLNKSAQISQHLAQCTTGVAGSNLFNRELRLGARAAVFRGKAVLLGEPGAGKTCLAHRWIFPERYRLSHSEAGQQGELKKWSCNTHVLQDPALVESDVIDMPGAPHLEYGRVRQLAQVQLLVLCFSLAEPQGVERLLKVTLPELVRNWPAKRQIAPIMLIGCQADKSSAAPGCTQVLADLLGASFWIETSALTGQGCPEASRALMQMVQSQVHTKRVPSAAWRWNSLQLVSSFQHILQQFPHPTRAQVAAALVSSSMCALLRLPAPHRLRRMCRDAVNWRFLQHLVGCSFSHDAGSDEEVTLEQYSAWMQRVQLFNAAVTVQGLWRGYRVRHGRYIAPPRASPEACHEHHHHHDVPLGGGSQIDALKHLGVLAALKTLGGLQARPELVHHVEHALERFEQQPAHETSLLPGVLPIALQAKMQHQAALMLQAIGQADAAAVDQMLLQFKAELGSTGLQTHQLQGDLASEHLKLAHAAISSGSIQILSGVLLARADVNSFDNDTHCTPLLRAAALPSASAATAMCKLLVRESADVTCFDQDSNTALHIGCISGNSEVVNLILGVNPGLYGIRNGQDRSPLEEAVINERKKVVQQLVSTGFASCGAVMKAAIKLCPNSVSMLALSCELGADLDSFGQLHDSPPLLEATTVQNLSAMQHLLCARASVDQAQLSTGMTSLHRASLIVDTKAVSLLLQHKADVQASFQYSSWSGLTALHCVFGLTYREWSQFKYVRNETGLELLQVLIEAGAELGVQDSEGLSILHRAALLGDARMLAELLGHSQCRELLSSRSKAMRASPLHYGCMSGSAACCSLLLEHSADQHALDARGRSPLVYAAQSHDLDTFFVMLETGCDHMIIDDRGQNLVHAVCRGVMFQGRQLHTVRKGLIDNVAQILEALAAVELSIVHTDHTNSTPLHIAAKYMNACALGWLLEQEPYASSQQLVCAQDIHGRTAYHWSFWQSLTHDYPEMNLDLEDAGASSEELQCSEVLQQYNLQTVLGEGAFGAVLLGQNKSTLEPVAVKFQNAKQIVSDPPRMYKLKDGKRMLLDEIMLQQQGAHRFVVGIVDSFEHQNFLTICLELLSHDLNSDVQSTLSVAQVQAQMAMALAGLAHLHKLCIVHADLKEDNLLMSHTGELKIADFGTAQRLPPKELCMSKMGTPIYFSPERVMHQGFGPPADCFALGVIYYRLLCGEHPYLLIDSTWNDFEQFVQKKTGFGSLDAEVRNTIRQLLHHDTACRWTAATALKAPAHKAAMEQLNDPPKSNIEESVISI